MKTEKTTIGGAKIILAILIAALFILSLNLSYIIFIMFLLLLLTFFIAINFSVPVTTFELDMKVKPDVQLISGSLKKISHNVYKNDKESRRIRISEFYDGELCFRVNDIFVTFDQNTDIYIEIINFNKWQFICKNAEIIGKCIEPDISTIPRVNKVVVSFSVAVTLLLSMLICFVCSKSYDNSYEKTTANRIGNFSALSGNESTQIKLYGSEAAEDAFYKELPDINLIVITKDKNCFFDSESRYNNPEIVNTVLMMYEDNISGNLYNDDEEQATELPENTTYYNLTELYMNIPIADAEGLDAGDGLHTLGELFNGDIAYRTLTGYSAVREWFREQYHMNISSVTEIPESVFADCYGTERSMGIMLSRDFIRFMQLNYSDMSDSEYYNSGVRDMLAEKPVVFPESLRSGMAELAERLEITKDDSNLNLNRNVMAMLDGKSIIAFGNTVRQSGKGSYLIKKDAAAETEQGMSFRTIVHSNWDIVMADVLESLSNMNNGMYYVFCENDNSQALSRIKSSLENTELNAFLESLARASDIIGSDNVDEQPKMQYVFCIRTLELNLTSLVDEPNVYLCNEPFEIEPYTNKLICHSLYYCLREKKEVP